MVEELQLFVVVSVMEKGRIPFVKRRVSREKTTLLVVVEEMYSKQYFLLLLLLLHFCAQNPIFLLSFFLVLSAFFSFSPTSKFCLLACCPFTISLILGVASVTGFPLTFYHTAPFFTSSNHLTLVDLVAINYHFSGEIQMENISFIKTTWKTNLRSRG